MERRLDVEIGANLTPLNQNLTRAGQSINQFAQNAQQAGNRMAGAFDRPRDAMGRFVSSGQRAASQLSAAFGPRLSQSLARIGDAAERAGKKLSVGLTLPLGAALVKIKEAYGEFDSLARGMATIEKNAQSLAGRLALLRDMSKLPGIDFAASIRGDLRLRGVFNTMMDIDKASKLSERSLRAFGNALASSGGNGSDLREVTTQLSQMAGSGKLQGDELRVISERVPQARAAIMAAFGTLDTELLNSKYNVAQIIEGIVVELEKLPKASGGINNAFKNLGTSMFAGLASIGQQLDQNLNITGFIDRISGFIDRMAESFVNLSPSTQNLIALLGGLAAATGPLLVVFGFLATSVLPGIISAFTLLGGPVVAAAVAIVAAGVLIITNWESVKQTLSDTGVLGMLAGAANAAKTAIVNSWNYIKEVVSDSGIWSEMQGAASAAFDFIKSALGVLSKVFRGEWGDFPVQVRLALAQVTTITKAAIQILTGLFSDSLQTFSGIMNALSGILQGNWKSIGTGLLQIVSGLMSSLIGLVSGGVSLLGRLFANFVEAIGGDKIAAGIRRGMDSMQGYANRVRTGLRTWDNQPSQLKQVDTNKPRKGPYDDYTFGGDRPFVPPKAAPLGIGDELDKAKDRLKALKAEIAGYNLKGLKVPPALMAEYNALSKRVKAATDATKLAKLPKEVIDSFKIPATDVEYWQERVESITKSIDRLREKGLPVSEASIKSLEVATERVEHFKKLADDFKDREIKLTVRVTQAGETTTSKERAGQDNSQKNPLPIGIKSVFASGADGAPPPLPHFDKFLEKWKEAQEKTTAAATAFRSALDASRDAVAQGFAGFLAGIGESIGSGGNPLKAALKAILGFIADYAIKIGTAALISSAALTAAAPFLGGLTLPQGIGLKVTGAGLILAGGLVKGLMSGGGGRREMAEGGLAYGRTDATIGEYAGAANDPELVGRLSTVTKYINQAVRSAILPMRSAIDQLRVPSFNIDSLAALPALRMAEMGSAKRQTVDVNIGVQNIRLDGHIIDIALTEVQKAKREFYG